MSQWPSANAKTAISHQNNLFVNTGGLYIKCYIYYSLLLLERSKGRICGVTGRSYVSYIYKVSLFFEKSRYINVFWPYSLPQSPFPFHPRLLPKHDLNFTFFLFSIFLKNHLLNTVSVTFIHMSVGPPLEQSNLQGATPSRKNYFPSFRSHQLPISPQLWMGLVSPSWYTKEFLLAPSCQVTTTAVNSWVEWHVTSRKQHVTALLPIFLLSHSLFRLFPKVSWTWGGREIGNIS